MTRGKPGPEALAGHLDHLAAGWTAHQPGAAHAVAQVLGRQLQEGPDIPVAAGDNAARFRLDLSGIYLRGLGEEVRCLLVGGGGPATAEAFESFWREEGAGKTSLPLFFCASDEAYEVVGRGLPRWCGAAFSPAELRDLALSDQPRALLKRVIRRVIIRRRLSLYNICRPATGNAFFGRARELAMLYENQLTNYAISGPGRVGKTSLMKRHKENLTRQRDPRANRAFEIDFYSLPKTDPDVVARHIAMAIHSGSRSDRLHASDLVGFLRYESNQHDGPLELLLDETDEVCGGTAFRQLAQAAKDGHVRLIMAGRKGLFDYAVRNESTFGGRSKLLRLTPLDPGDARALIREPLGDLGLALRDAQRVLDYVLQQTGRLPHLIQFYCEQLVELTTERGLDEVSFELVRNMEAQGEFSQYFLGPLYEVRSRATRDLAHAVLAAAQSRFTTAELAGLVEPLGVDSSPEHVRQLCDELVIQNILSWENDGHAMAYAVAGQALRHFARRAGLLRSGGG